MKLTVAQPPALRTIKPPWKEAVVLVCRKCSGNDDGDLRDWLKPRLKALGHKKAIKVVATGCLGVCPKRRVVVVHAPRGAPARTLVVGKKDREALLQQLTGEDEATD